MLTIATTDPSRLIEHVCKGLGRDMVATDEERAIDKRKDVSYRRDLARFTSAEYASTLQAEFPR